LLYLSACSCHASSCSCHTEAVFSFLVLTFRASIWLRVERAELPTGTLCVQPCGEVDEVIEVALAF